MKNNNYLESIIKEYTKDVTMACHMMLEALYLKSKEELIRYRGIQATGEFFLNGINSFTFHGRGCRFSNEAVKIDWDFGFGENWCGLDPWKLFYYIKDNKKNNEYDDGNQIKKIFEDLVRDKKMHIKFGLYYYL